MQNQLLEQLDSKVRALIDEVEVLRVEIEELKIINQNLSDERTHWARQREQDRVDAGSHGGLMVG